MGRIHPLVVVVAGLALGGCAKTSTHPGESADAPLTDQPSAPETKPAAPVVDEEAAAAPGPARAHSVPDMRATCALEIERQIACVEQYIPMIVDVRIKLDLPAGMAARGKDEAGRQALLVEAREEFPEHYSRDKIPAICERRQAMAEQMPPELLAELNALGPDCHTAPDCAAFARCTAPVVERILAATAKAGPR